MRKIFATLLLFCACSTPHSFSIAIDPASMPIHLLAYTKDLMGTIATKENLTLSLTQRSWDNLTEGLDEELYPAMISTLPKTLISTAKYTFSDPLILLGSVLVAKEPCTLETLSGQIVAMQGSPEELALIERYPNITFLFYVNIQQALEQVSHGEVKAALVPFLAAKQYTAPPLMITTPPLTSEALSLITLKGHHPSLIRAVNQGLSSVDKEALLTKWSLNASP